MKQDAARPPVTDTTAVPRSDAGDHRHDADADADVGDASPMRARGRSGLIVAGSLLAGLLAAVLLVVGPFGGDREPVITGGLLVGFAIGWALLVLLSARLTDRTQRWATAPAAAMALTGAALIVGAPGAGTMSALGWVWPPLLLALVVWMTVHARRRPVSRVQPWLLYPVFGVLGLAAVGGAYETLGNATDPVLAHITGARLLDVGGHRLDIRCTGSGGPTVVLEAGLGESAAAMARWIAPDVGRVTTVCVYDRAGHGRSDPAPAGAAVAARDLHTLLRRAHVPGPYVIAGHSLGGMFALSYAQRYPVQVAGVVLLDSMHPHQHNAFAGTDRLLAVVPTLARMGLARVLSDPKDGKPTAQAAQFVRDVDEMPAELDRAAKLRTLGDRPLVVVTAGTGSPASWSAEQNDLAALSSNSIHRTIAGATHQSLIDAEPDAAASGRAIRDVVTAVQRASCPAHMPNGTSGPAIVAACPLASG
jgi:pimeloyl-ACP methyl ester carboxylesterase